MPDFEVVTMGRVGVDLYPPRTDAGPADVTSSGKFLGGRATNVAAARHGRRSERAMEAGRV